MNKINWNFDNTYSTLQESFVSKTSPELVIFNYNLAKELGLDFSLTDKKTCPNYFLEIYCLKARAEVTS